MAEAYSSDDSYDEELDRFMRGFEYLWNCAVCLQPAQCGLILEDQYRDTDSLLQYTYFDTVEKVYWLRCPYCQHSFHKNCATNLTLGELEYYGWACCREIDYTHFRGGLIPNRDVLSYIDVIRLCAYIFGHFSVLLFGVTFQHFYFADFAYVQPSTRNMSLILFAFFLLLLLMLMAKGAEAAGGGVKRKRDDDSGRNFRFSFGYFFGVQYRTLCLVFVV